ncbi:MAG: protein-disulfide reductase DsbD domain-containing protein [Terriglobales bacterium]
MRLKASILLISLLSSQVIAQESFGRKAPSVTLLPVPVENVTRGKSGTVELQFRVASGFHINSNTPKQDYLIRTDLKLDPPTDIIVGKVIYPPGVDRSLPFAPDEKLSVYTGPFAVAVTVRPLVSVPAGKYSFRGELKYQACDNAACYPPKKLPVEFEVRVLKNRVPPRRNPAQSPNVHR